MLKNIVMIRFIDYSEEEKSQLILEVNSKLNNLRLWISEILRLETGINISDREVAFDFILTINFQDKNSLEIYLNHPEHLKVIYFLNSLKIETAVVDYYI